MSQAIIKSCLNCGTEFIPKSAKGVYCNDTCRKAYSRRGKSTQPEVEELTEKVEQSLKYQALNLSDAPTDKLERLKWFKKQR